jgi:ATP-dependent RNA helicase RhlE
MKFEKFFIAEEIKENLFKNGFHHTTDIQYKAIPPILNDEDVLAIAQTGTGKTAAFAIPVIHKIHASKTSKRNRSIQCLVMVPTRELAQQIGEVFRMFSKHTKVNSFAIYGGIEQERQIDQLEDGIDILIATPGRMFDLERQGVLDLSGVKILVLDEADRMLDLGFIDDIEHIKKLIKHRHQTLFFSATISPKIKRLAYSLIQSNAMRIQISPENTISKNITHSVVKVAMDEKRHLLVNFLESGEAQKVIIFVRTQVRVERVVTHLAKHNIHVSSLHGGMLQAERDQNLQDFRDGKTSILIATDVTARGIDLPGISHVINYDLPDLAENYVHRIGRTGRGFAKGDAISFCAPEERVKLLDIEDFLNMKLQEQKVDSRYKMNLPKAEDMTFSEFIAAEEAIRDSKKRKKKK